MSLRAARDEGTFQRGEKLKKTEKLHKGARQPPPPLAGRRPPRYSQDEPREKPIGKGFDKIPQRQQRPRERRANEQGQILSLPVQSTPINPNAAPAMEEPQKTTVSAETGPRPLGGTVALIRRGRGRALARDERRYADAIRDDEQAEHGGRADARQDIHPGGRPSRYWERGRQAPRHLAARFLPSYEIFELSYL